MLDIASEEAVLGRWPRRLLHVPSLTSYEWQTGNKYGDSVEPEYNALTYTWGRWRLKDATSATPREKPEIHSLPISGVAWSLPRVDPAHFTVQQLERVIGEVAKSRHLHMTRWTKPVDFIWLDIACIDQRGSEPRSAAEIGRQAQIFKGAQSVCAWFTTLTLEALEKAVLAFRTVTDSGFQGNDDDTSGIRDVERFLSDPWFSSLWTLQETYLRDDANLLDRDGNLLKFPPPAPWTDNPQLLDFFEHGGIWCSMCLKMEGDLSNSAIYTRIRRLIEKRGLKALASMNAMGTYEAALMRTTTRPEDRVYGIQQIFDFRLGSSAPDASPTRQFTLVELEDEMGVALMKKYPLQSQYHVFTRPVPAEKRWRMNTYSVVPTSTNDYGHSMWESSEEDSPYCSFCLKRTTAGSMTIWWQGPIAPLSDVVRACDAVKGEELFGELYRNQDNLLVMLDVAEEHVSLSNEASGFHLIPKGPQQRQLQNRLIKPVAGSSIQVLLLGTSSGERYSYMVGVLLLQGGTAEWTRIGICQWETSDLQVSDLSSSQSDFLNGRGSGWRHSGGIYGYSST